MTFEKGPSPRCQRSIICICCSLWWSPAAGVSLSSLSICSGLELDGVGGDVLLDA